MPDTTKTASPEEGGAIIWRGEEYDLIFDLNVLELIQNKYGTLGKWAALTDGEERTEPDAEAIKYGFFAMVNEWLAIQNEDHNAGRQPITLRQAGRMITELGLRHATRLINREVIESTRSAEKNL